MQLLKIFAKHNPSSIPATNSPEREELTEKPLPLFSVKGFGGKLELYEKEVRILKRSWINYILHFLAGSVPPHDHVIPIRHLSGVTIIRPPFFNNYIFFSYPGGPYTTGYQLYDATLECSLIMNFFDNREFFEFKDRLDALNRKI